MGIIPNTTRATFATAKAGTDRVQILTPSLARVAALSANGAKQIFTVDFTGRNSGSMRGKFFRVDSLKGLRHVYYDRTDISLDPLVAARTSVLIDTAINGKYLNAGRVCELLKNFFNTNAISDYLSDWTSGNTFNLEAKTVGTRTNATEGNSGFTFAVSREGAAASKTTAKVTFTGGETGGDYFGFEDLNGHVCYWLSTDGTPETLGVPETGLAGYRFVNFNLPDGVSPTAANCSLYFYNAIISDGQLDAVRVGNVVTVTSKAFGFSTDPFTASGGMTLSAISSGGVGLKEKYSVTVPADVSTLNAKYFLATFGGVDCYVWFYGADPAPNSSGVAVVSASNESAAALASRTADALNSTGDFVANAVANVLTVRGLADGVRSVADVGTSATAVASVRTGAGLKTLRRELSQQAAEIVAGVSDFASQKARFSASNPATPSFTKNPSFFLSAKTCHHVPFYAGNGKGCLVSPSHLVSASHYAPALNSTVYVENPLGGFLTRTVAQKTSNVGGGDIELIRLSAALPSEIVFARVFPNSFGGKIPDFNSRERFSCFNVDQFDNARLFEFSFLYGNNAYVGKPADATLSALHLDPAVGDSGSAVFCFVKELPVLLFTFVGFGDGYDPALTFEAPTKGVGPFVSGHINAINAAMLAQGSGETLTEINLDEFDA